MKELGTLLLVTRQLQVRLTLPAEKWPAGVLAVIGHQHVGVGRLGGDEEGVLWHVLLPDPSVYGSFQMKRKIFLRKLLKILRRRKLMEDIKPKQTSENQIKHRQSRNQISGDVY